MKIYNLLPGDIVLVPGLLVLAAKFTPEFHITDFHPTGSDWRYPDSRLSNFSCDHIDPKLNTPTLAIIINTWPVTMLMLLGKRPCLRWICPGQESQLILTD